MITIAPPVLGDRQQSCTGVLPYTPLDQDVLSGLADDDPHRFGPVAPPWLAPLFYLSIVAGVLLIAIVGVLLLWRGLRRGPSS